MSETSKTIKDAPRPNCTCGTYDHALDCPLGTYLRRQANERAGDKTRLRDLAAQFRNAAAEAEGTKTKTIVWPLTVERAREYADTFERAADGWTKSILY
jgi:hypothetical protein